MSTLINPNYRALDNTGAVMPGAKLYTYATGSSTPLATYSDEARTAANANPVVADANGFFGRLYGTPATLYRLVLKSSADVTVRTEDNVAPLESSYSSAATRLKQLVACPLDYGAVGDGVANDAVALQAAITAAIGVVDLAGKTYKCNSSLTLKSNLEIRNGTIDASSLAGALFSAVGSQVFANAALSSNMLVGESLIQCAINPGAMKGDLALVSADYNMQSSSNDIGEIFKIYTVVNSAPTTELTVVEGVVNEVGYLTANSAACGVYRPVENVRLSRLRLIAGASVTNLVLGNYCDDFAVMDCDFTCAGIANSSAAIRFMHCHDCGVLRCSFTSLVASTERGVAIDGASRHCYVDQCRFNNMGSAATLPNKGAVRIGNTSVIGQPIHTRVSRCVFAKCPVSVGNHCYANRTKVDHCVVTDVYDGAATPTYGVYSGGLSLTVSSCTFLMKNQAGYGGGYAIYGELSGSAMVVRDFKDEVVIRDVKAYSELTVGINYTATGLHTNRSFVIDGIIGVEGLALATGACRPFVSIDGAAFVVLTNSQMARGVFANCGRVDIDKSSFTYVNGSLVSFDAAPATLTACKFAGSGYTEAILNTGTANVRCVNCEFAGGGGTSVGAHVHAVGDTFESCLFSGTFSKAINCTAAIVKGCRFTGIIAEGVYCAGGPAVVNGNFFGSLTATYGPKAPIELIDADYSVVSGNTIYGVSASSGHLIKLGTACAFCSVTGNVAYYQEASTNNIVYAEAPNQCVFSSNSFYRSGDEAANINCVQIAGPSNPNRCVFSGNVLVNGTYGIDYSTGMNGLADGNSYDSMSTAATNGAGLTSGDAI